MWVCFMRLLQNNENYGSIKERLTMIDLMLPAALTYTFRSNTMNSTCMRSLNNIGLFQDLELKSHLH